MKVSEALRDLAARPQDADLLICAHEFPGMENQAWFVTHFTTGDSERFVFAEGARPPADSESEPRGPMGGETGKHSGQADGAGAGGGADRGDRAPGPVGDE